MPQRFLHSDLYLFLTKIIFPAFLAVGIKIAIEMKKNNGTFSLLNFILSMTIGVGGAYISSDWVQAVMSSQYVSIAIALIAIVSDKVGSFLIYKLNVELFLTAFFNGLFNYLTNLFNNNNNSGCK